MSSIHWETDEERDLLGEELLDRLTPVEAERAMERLRYGTPPTGLSRYFTVGREHELRILDEMFVDELRDEALLVRANYGSGKTHLLQLIRDIALDRGWAVAFVHVAAQSGVRFNRMDQVAAAVCRRIELPGGRRSPGIRHLFDAFVTADQRVLDPDAAADRLEISDDERWRYSDGLTSPALWTALRAYVLGDDDAKDLAIQWLEDDDREKILKRRLYTELVEDLYVGDSRPEWQVYRDLNIRSDDYAQCWDMLRDLGRLARVSGYGGLVLLFDEFEDVLQNLRNRLWEEKALTNLYRFFDGEAGVPSCFAVTPEFAHKTRLHFLAKGNFDFDYAKLDRLTHFELSPIDLDDFLVLAFRIVDLHGHAHHWAPWDELDPHDVGEFIGGSWETSNPSRVRVALTSLVRYLDERLEELDDD